MQNALVILGAMRLRCAHGPGCRLRLPQGEESLSETQEAWRVRPVRLDAQAGFVGSGVDESGCEVRPAPRGAHFLDRVGDLHPERTLQSAQRNDDKAADVACSTSFRSGDSGLLPFREGGAHPRAVHS